MPKTALIGGTSLLESKRFQDACPLEVETPYGSVQLHEQAGFLFLQRHGVEAYQPPHRINHRAHLMALHQAGVDRILGVGSVGSLRLDIPPGTICFPDDFFAPNLVITFYDDDRGHRVVEFNAAWRNRLLEAWSEAGLPPPVHHGVYWQTIGPRFETAAEIRMFQPLAHFVGMTLASECILAAELGLPYAAVCMVDNYANGVSPEPLSLQSFKEQVRRNESTLVDRLEAVLGELDREAAN